MRTEWNNEADETKIVMLDGIPQKHVYEADDEEGWIVRAKLDNGVPVRISGGDAVATERVTGKVEFIRRDNPQ